MAVRYHMVELEPHTLKCCMLLDRIISPRDCVWVQRARSLPDVGSDDRHPAVAASVAITRDGGSLHVGRRIAGWIAQRLRHHGGIVEGLRVAHVEIGAAPVWIGPVPYRLRISFSKQCFGNSAITGQMGVHRPTERRPRGVNLRDRSMHERFRGSKVLTRGSLPSSGCLLSLREWRTRNQGPFRTQRALSLIQCASRATDVLTDCASEAALRLRVCHISIARRYTYEGRWIMDFALAEKAASFWCKSLVQIATSVPVPTTIATGRDRNRVS